MDGIDVTAARAKIERVKGRLAELDALDRDLDALLGPTASAAVPASTFPALGDQTPKSAPQRPAKRRAAPKATQTPAKRQKRAAAPADAPAAPKRSAPGAGPRAAIVALLEAGPLTADEFAAALAGMDGTHEAKRQALARLQKAGTVQRDPGGSYRLGARPT